MFLLKSSMNQLLLFQAQDFPEMSSWLHKGEYVSPEVINELIPIMGQSVLQKILANMTTAPCFSILADEATDISHNEKMSLSIRWLIGSMQFMKRHLA